MVKIQNDVTTLFREVFTKELLDGGYTLTEEAGTDVLLVKPAIVDLDVVAPDIQRSSFNRSYSDRSGELTLNIELFDSLTNDKIARATDRKRDYNQGYAEWRSSVNNAAFARRMMTSWARTLVSALDEARAATTRSE